MWKRYTKDSVIEDGAQCLLLFDRGDKYYQTFGVYFMGNRFGAFSVEDMHNRCEVVNPSYYFELPEYLSLDGTSAQEHPDLIDIAKNAVVS